METTSRHDNSCCLGHKATIQSNNFFAQDFFKAISIIHVKLAKLLSSFINIFLFAISWQLGPEVASELVIMMILYYRNEFYFC